MYIKQVVFVPRSSLVIYWVLSPSPAHRVAGWNPQVFSKVPTPDWGGHSKSVCAGRWRGGMWWAGRHVQGSDATTLLVQHRSSPPPPPAKGSRGGPIVG